MLTGADILQLVFIHVSGHLRDEYPLGRIAGSSYGYDADKVTAGKAAEKMLEWWGKNHEKHPLQIGDKPPKPKKEGEEEEKPDPVEEIKKLPARRYPKPPSMVHDR